MMSLVTSTSSSCSLRIKSNSINAALSVPRFPQFRISVPKNIPTKELLEGMRIGDSYAAAVKVEQVQSNSTWTPQMYAVLEAVSDRIEMHQNIKEQRENWNSLLLNSINMMTLTATTMSGISAARVGHDNSILGLNLASTLLFSAATGTLVLMNKIQPSQLTEEQRNATKLFKQLQNHIQMLLAIGNPTEDDVRDAMEKVLALDKAFPLPLLGAMLEKFPSSFAPAVWWPKNIVTKQRKQSNKTESNGWNQELETELRDILDVIKRKDVEDYERLGNIALKVNKVLAISGPLLTGIAAIGAVHGGSVAATVAVAAGALATIVNTLEHGGQVGMVFEMYRNCAGFFSLMEETIESTLESDVERRENGELFEMKMGLKLGRSLSQLKDLVKKSKYSRIEGSPVEEFASKLF